jgi:glycerophosphoryl diester phosphodiesterase
VAGGSSSARATASCFDEPTALADRVGARRVSIARRLYGHRGASCEWPENTIESFARALQVGATALETDAHLTRDGRVVLSHDPRGARMCGVDLAICDRSLAEVQRWDAGFGFVDGDKNRPFAGKGLRIPTLHELFDAAPDAHINIDIKQATPPMVAPLLQVVRERRGEERVTIASFHGTVLDELRAHGYRGEIALSRNEVLALMLPARLAKRTVRGHAAQIPVRAGPIDLASRPFIEKCHALGIRVDYWVVNDAVEAEVLLDRGADGIMTDDPGAIARLMHRF